nr:MAG TPA: hypothetical protein [Caudoviricetes sp.]
MALREIPVRVGCKENDLSIVVYGGIRSCKHRGSSQTDVKQIMAGGLAHFLR